MYRAMVLAGAVAIALAGVLTFTMTADRSTRPCPVPDDQDVCFDKFIAKCGDGSWSVRFDYNDLCTGHGGVVSVARNAPPQ